MQTTYIKYLEDNMKKFLGFISIILVCVLLVGCGANNAQTKLATQKLSTGLDKIVAQVKKLENINTDNLDITSSLGIYEDYEDEYEYNNDEIYSTNRYGNRRANQYGYARQRTPMKFNVPTHNNLVKQTNASFGGYRNNNPRQVRNSRKFNFVSKDTEDAYGSLYTICNNCCELNEEYSACKQDLLANCSTAKELLAELSKSGKNVSESDLKTLNGYYEVLTRCLSSLQNCSSCSSCVKNVNTKKANLASNCGSMNAEYLQIYNTLDSNCCSCSNCNSSIQDLIGFVNKLLGNSSSNITRDNVSNAGRYHRHYRNRNFDTDYNTTPRYRDRIVEDDYDRTINKNPMFEQDRQYNYTPTNPQPQVENTNNDRTLNNHPYSTQNDANQNNIQNSVPASNDINSNISNNSTNNINNIEQNDRKIISQEKIVEKDNSTAGPAKTHQNFDFQQTNRNDMSNQKNIDNNTQHEHAHNFAENETYNSNNQINKTTKNINKRPINIIRKNPVKVANSNSNKGYNNYSDFNKSKTDMKISFGPKNVRAKIA